jgi:hypothetical protein
MKVERVRVRKGREVEGLRGGRMKVWLAEG